MQTSTFGRSSTSWTVRQCHIVEAIEFTAESDALQYAVVLGVQPHQGLVTSDANIQCQLISN